MGSWGQTKDYKIGICCFSIKHAELRSKSKDWLALEQDNVFGWRDMSIRGLLFHGDLINLLVLNNNHSLIQLIFIDLLVLLVLYLVWVFPPLLPLVSIISCN